MEFELDPDRSARSREGLHFGHIVASKGLVWPHASVLRLQLIAPRCGSGASVSLPSEWTMPTERSESAWDGVHSIDALVPVVSWIAAAAHAIRANMLVAPKAGAGPAAAQEGCRYAS
jgi:hypothetical protein